MESSSLTWNLPQSQIIRKRINKPLTLAEKARVRCAVGPTVDPYEL